MAEESEQTFDNRINALMSEYAKIAGAGFPKDQEQKFREKLLREPEQVREPIQAFIQMNEEIAEDIIKNPAPHRWN